MKILLFGISNVGKTVIGKELANQIGWKFIDLDSFIIKNFKTMENFIRKLNVDIDRANYRGNLLKEILESEHEDVVIAVSPIFFRKVIEKALSFEKDIIKINLIDSPKNVFDRLVFTDENDVIMDKIPVNDYDPSYGYYTVDKYKRLHKAHYMREIREDLKYMNKVLKNICTDYNIDGNSITYCAKDLIKKYELESKVKEVSNLILEENCLINEFKPYEVKEQDWKLFKSKIKLWQERYMDDLIKKYIAFLNEDTLSSTKIITLKKMLNKDMKSPGVSVDLRRSMLLESIISLILNKIITFDDLEGFSDELIENLKEII